MTIGNATHRRRYIHLHSLFNMGLKGFERRLERLVEGAFSRAFRSGLRPIELGRKISRIFDDERMVDVRGRTVVPNQVTFELSPDDYQRFEQIATALCREIGEVGKEHVRDRGYSLMGPIEIHLARNPQLRTGNFKTRGEFHEDPDGTRGPSLILPTGERLRLGTGDLIIGRISDSDIVVDDPNVSRHHARITQETDSYLITDLKSMNGTTVNGANITRHVLNDGDTIGVGSRTIVFEAL